MLTDQQIKTVEDLLLKERDDAIEALREFDRSREESMGNELGELSVFRLHPADIGTEAMEQEKKFLLASAEGEHLYEIDEALRRLYKDRASFGSCQNCGKQISFERLEVVPETTLCADCKRQAES